MAYFCGPYPLCWKRGAPPEYALFPVSMVQLFFRVSNSTDAIVAVPFRRLKQNGNVGVINVRNVNPGSNKINFQMPPSPTR